MKFQECIRCGDWQNSGLHIRKKVRRAIITLVELNLIEVFVEPEMCENCQRAIGKKCSETLLKMCQDEERSKNYS